MNRLIAEIGEYNDSSIMKTLILLSLCVCRWTHVNQLSKEQLVSVPRLMTTMSYSVACAV